jgi:hypothetical protein
VYNITPKGKGSWVWGEGHTFTTLSQPHETITGFITLGLKRTQDTLQAESRFWNPCLDQLGVPFSVAIFFDVVFALSKGVPELDGLVA